MDNNNITMDVILQWSEAKLASELKSRGQNPGPIVQSTKKVYAKRLLQILEIEKKTSKVTKKVPEETVAATVEIPKKKKRKSVPRKKKLVADVIPEIVDMQNMSVQAQATNSEESYASYVNDSTADVMDTDYAGVDEAMDTDNAGFDEAVVPKPNTTAVNVVESMEGVNVVKTSTAYQQFSQAPSYYKSAYQHPQTDLLYSPSSRAAMIRQSVRRRRSIHPETLTEDRKPAEKVIVKEMPKEKGHSWPHIVIIFVIFMLFTWLVYSVMESNPSLLIQ